MQMACQEFGSIYNAMTRDMGRKLDMYQISLQTRYGDPRIYAQQQEIAARDTAAAEYMKSKKTSQLLEDAYKRQTERNRAIHNSRLSNRTGHKSKERPRSQEQMEHHTSQQQRSDPGPVDQVHSSVTKTDPQTYHQSE